MMTRKAIVTKLERALENAKAGRFGMAADEANSASVWCQERSELATKAEKDGKSRKEIQAFSR